jgi:hypothetical protein
MIWPQINTIFLPCTEENPWVSLEHKEIHRIANWKHIMVLEENRMLHRRIEQFGEEFHTTHTKHVENTELLRLL